MTTSQSKSKPALVNGRGKPQVVLTPSDTTTTSPTNDNFNSKASSIPVPGSTFIIKSASCGRVLTLYEGKLILAFEGGLGSIFWECLESAGWLGLRNWASGCYMGMHKSGKLNCWQQKIEWSGEDCANLCVRQVQEGGYVILGSQNECVTLSRIGLVVEEGVERLAKVDPEVSDGHFWEFIKV